MQTANNLTSLHIYAGWSSSLLFAFTTKVAFTKTQLLMKMRLINQSKGKILSANFFCMIYVISTTHKVAVSIPFHTPLPETVVNK